MECKISSANPSVSAFELNSPSPLVFKTSIEPIIENGRPTGKFKVTPKDKRDLGKYECLPRNSAGVNICELNLILGGYPEPPHGCTIGYNRNSNKTTAQINCQVGFNQGGARSEFVVYERLNDGTLKHSGSVNIYDTKQTEVGYLTKEIDEYDYYEFVVMQSNNYGNSSQVVLTIGVRAPGK